jgi:hypothetical protein
MKNLKVCFATPCNEEKLKNAPPCHYGKLKSAPPCLYEKLKGMDCTPWGLRHE